MMRNPNVLIPLLLVALCSGCQSLKNVFARKNPPAPSLLTPSTQGPTLEQITSAINRNSMVIRNMKTEDATIMVPGVLWPVRAQLTYERPKRLRIQGGATTLTGQEIDFGSNETLFWLWVRRLPEKEMYYCRHDQFPSCPVRSMVPIEPDWVIEAIGITEFQPEEQHEGPFPAEDGNLLIVTRRQTPAGQFIKKTTVGAKTGWVLRQEMYSPQNELVAIAISSDHRYDKGTGVLYAKKIEVQCQGAEGKMTIDLGSPTFNSPTPFSSAMFTMPVYDGFKPVDICGPEFLQSRGMVVPTPLAHPLPSTVNPVPQPPASHDLTPTPTPQPSTYYIQGATPEATIQTIVK